MRQTWFQVAIIAKLKAFQYHALARNHIVRLPTHAPFANEDGSNAVRIPEPNDSKTGKHSDTCVRTFDFIVYFFETFKDIFGIHANLSCVLQRGRKYVEK